MRDRADRILGGREANAQQLVAAEGGEPLKRQGQMRAALVRGDGVDFVDDHGAGSREHLAPGLRAEQDVKQFRRRYQDVGRPPAHPLTLGRRRVAGTHPRADLDVSEPPPNELLPDAGQRRLQVAVNIVRERLQRRDIDNVGRVGQIPFEALPDQIIDGRKKRRERLARAGRGGDQGVPARLDRRPGFELRRGGRGETLGEPRGDRGVEECSGACIGPGGCGGRGDALPPARAAGGWRIQSQSRRGVSQIALLVVLSLNQMIRQASHMVSDGDLVKR